MTIKQIYIARHGYRANWAPPPHPPNPTGIDSDPPLAPHGVAQSKQLAAYLHSLPSIDRPQFILSSPFYRCLETCQPICDMLGIQVAIDRGISEWFRKKRKTKPIPADYDQLKEFFGPKMFVPEGEWPRDTAVGVVPDVTGETFHDIFERVKRFWEKFVPVFESKYPDIENILVITHAASAIALGSVLLKLNSVTDYIDDNQTMIRCGACSVSKYIRDDNDNDQNQKWKIVMNGNCEFLTMGEEMHWDFAMGVEAGSADDVKMRQAKAADAEAKAKLKQLGVEQVDEPSTNQSETVTELATGADGDINNEEFENFYITIDVPMFGKKEGLEEMNRTSAPISTTPRSKINVIKPSAQLQFTDINHPNPLIKISNNIISPSEAGAGGPGSTNGNTEVVNTSAIIDGKIFEMGWKSLVGTDLVFDDYGELIGTVKEHLVHNDRVKIVPNDSGIKDEDLEEEEEEYEDDNGMVSEEKDTQSQFLKRAIKLAKRKEGASTTANTTVDTTMN